MESGKTMTKRDILRYVAALAAFFALGCGAALILRAYDRQADTPTPLTGGQLLDLSAFGFTLRVPDAYALYDLTQDHLSSGGDALFAGCASGEGQTLYLYCYRNEQGDAIDDYAEQELVTYYVSAGGEDVRTRTLGGRRFICYSAQVLSDEDGEAQLWHTYETWDGELHLVFETQLAARDALPMLATLEFNQHE